MKKTSGTRSYPEKWVVIGFLILFANSGYLASFSEASIFYAANIFLHVGIGIVLIVPFAIYAHRFARQEAYRDKDIARYTSLIGYYALLIGMGTGIALAIVSTSHLWLLHLHIITCCIGIAFFITAIRRIGHRISVDNRFNTAGRFLLTFAVVGVCIPVLIHAYHYALPGDDGVIYNPRPAPKSMAEEAMSGEGGIFFPSSFRTDSRSHLSPLFLTNSESCGTSGCHPDIYRQWSSSTHRYSAFNNSWYRKSLIKMEEQAGLQATKWCAGCHAPAALASGVADQPVSEQMNSAVSQTGISCNACHAITEVKSTMGQAHYVLQQPRFMNWLASDNSWLRTLYGLFVRFDPEPHRQTFMKPFHTKDTSEFCSSCHKAHVDQPINQAHWLSIMNDYDSWQNSSFSGKGVLDPHPVTQKKSCADCHMPLVESDDAGNKNGKVHDHRFIGANTWQSTQRKDQDHHNATLEFLKDDRISLDIFAISHASEPPVRGSHSEIVQNFKRTKIDERIYTATSSLNPEERWSLQTGAAEKQFADSVIAPIDQHSAHFYRGKSFRVDVVVRSRDIGHQFPAGAADMVEAWLEVKAVDEHDKIIFWSGGVNSNHAGSIDSSAHFYGSVLIDSTGARIYHDESWNAYAVARANFLPPNNAEVVRYRIHVPNDCGEQIKLIAKLNYREITPEYRSRIKGSFNGKEASNQLMPATCPKPSPAPIAIASAQTTFQINDDHKTHDASSHSCNPDEGWRWNDYGIGLLRQGDLINAENAFLRASDLLAKSPDIWINLGVARLRADNIDEAKTAFRSALNLDQQSARALYYLGLAYKTEGRSTQALKNFKRVANLKNRDRETRIEIGRLYYHREDYRHAIRSFKRALKIDPEDPAVYYYMMHTYTAEGKPKSAKRVSGQYQRFKWNDEMEKAVVRAKKRNPFLQTSPHLYHEHHSVNSEFWQKDTIHASNGHNEND